MGYPVPGNYRYGTSKPIIKTKRRDNNRSLQKHIMLITIIKLRKSQMLSRHFVLTNNREGVSSPST